jgi:predicted nucleotide-binding protein
VPYHVRLSVGGLRTRDDEVKLDLDDTTLERQFIRPYREGRSITVNGRTIEPNEIRRLKISYSDATATELIHRLQIEDEKSRLRVISPPSYEWRAAARAYDVTKRFLQEPLNTNAQSIREPLSSPKPSTTGDRRSVFLVHGRWRDAVEAMRDFLVSLDLKVIEWEQAVRATGKASPYIGDILDAGFAMAHAATVLMTPDDVAYLHPDLRSPGEVPEPYIGQPRPNVIFEAGMAWQKFRDRTLLVEFGDLRGFSNLAGVHVVRLDGSPESRRAVALRLKNIGCAVDESSGRWLSAGRFPSGLRPVTAVDLGYEAAEQLQTRGTPHPVNALKGIPLRWILLARLAAIHRAQTDIGHVVLLDVEGIATETAEEITDVKDVLSELIVEELVEGFAETSARRAVDGACRITAAGLRRLRSEA